MRDKTLLAQLQALPLDAKVLMTQQRIREWYNYWHGNVVISFSGGKDSTVLTYLVHDMYPDVPLVFANTGLEYPEIQAFARKMGAEFVRPKMSFSEVISKYGYPIIGKEVAEAISFARRIVPQNPETVETLERETTRNRKRTELVGKRKNELLAFNSCTKDQKDSQEDTKKSDYGEQILSTEERITPPPQKNFTGEQDGEEQTSQGIRRFPRKNKLELQETRPMERLTKERTQKDRTSKTATHGERLIGKDGEEKQSPG